jgi:hypothetical protein
MCLLAAFSSCNIPSVMPSGVSNCCRYGVFVRVYMCVSSLAMLITGCSMIKSRYSIKWTFDILCSLEVRVAFVENRSYQLRMRARPWDVCIMAAASCAHPVVNKHILLQANRN